MYEKIYFSSKIWVVLIDLKHVFAMKPSEFDIFLSVDSYDKETAENCRNFYDAEKQNL